MRGSTIHRIVVACGGTGGHVFPGMAMAREFQRRGQAAELWLSGRDVEQLAAFDWNGPVERIPARGLPAGISWRTAWNSAVLMTSVCRCVWRMRRGRRPAAVLAMGSYASVGPGLAARLLGIPLVLHEANVVPGRALTMLSRWADAVAVAFPEAADFFKGVRSEVTGFPLREIDTTHGDDFEGALPFSHADTFTVLITGGSQGAHFLNKTVVEALCRLQTRGLRLQVIHLAGSRDEVMVRERYARAGVPSAVFGFLRRMDRAYAAAHLVVCRAGAATCAELAAAGVPALLVPLPSAARDHQTANAIAVVRTGAADMIAEHQLHPDWLADYLAEHAAAPATLERMRAAARPYSASAAAARTADLVLNVVQARSPA